MAPTAGCNEARRGGDPGDRRFGRAQAVPRRRRRRHGGRPGSAPGMGSAGSWQCRPGRRSLLRRRRATRNRWLALLVGGDGVRGGGRQRWRVNAIDRTAALPGPDRRTISDQAILLEHPRESLFGSAAAVRIITGRAAGAPMLARLDGRSEWPDGGQPGTILQVAGTAAEPRQTVARSTGARTCAGAGSRSS